jgi:ankyrin repeat protein
VFRELTDGFPCVEFQPAEILPPDAHIAAKSGQLAELERELKERRFAVLTERDDQGWQVLHQGVAGGNEDVVKLLVTNGAEINSRTHGGYGETPLRIAEKLHGTKSKIYLYLKKMGALSIGPEL